MTLKSIKSYIASTLGIDGGRLLFVVTMLWFHTFVDTLVEPLKRTLPAKVWFVRVDNKAPFLRFDKKPLGYWIGHAFAVVVILFLFASVGDISRRLVEVLL